MKWLVLAVLRALAGKEDVVLSTETKIAILVHLKAGVTQEKLADEYKIRRLTVGNIKKNEDKVQLFMSTMESMAMSKKGRTVMRLADNNKLDKGVYLWFVQKRTKDMPVKWTDSL